MQRVSVVIPTFNSGDLVNEAVESVFAQTAPPAEVVVVDDGSTDGTPKRLAPYGDRICYLFQNNKGVAAARNSGIRHTRSELIAFLDADDIWHPRKLEFQLDVLAKNPDLGLLGTGIFDWPAPAVPAVAGPPAEPVVLVPWRELMVKNYFVTSSVLVRRNLLEKAGLFDTALHGPEDYDLWSRIAELTAVANLYLPLTGYRNVAGSLSQQAHTMQEGLQHILRKLDKRKAWKGHWLLRRKACSYFNYSCAYMHGAAGSQRAALRRLLDSLAWYPFPYRRGEVRMPFARPRLLVAILLRLLRMRE